MADSDKLDLLLSMVQDINGRLDGIDGRLDGIDGRLDGIDGRLDGIDGRLDKLETDVAKVRLTQETRLIPAIEMMGAEWPDLCATVNKIKANQEAMSERQDQQELAIQKANENWERLKRAVAG